MNIESNYFAHLRFNDGGTLWFRDIFAGNSFFQIDDSRDVNTTTGGAPSIL